MRNLLRLVAGLNAAFQMLVGVGSIASPMLVAGTFGVGVAPSIVFLAVVRMFGGLLVGGGLLSALVAAKPDVDATVRRVIALCLIVNVAADIVVIGAGELPFAQLAVGMVLEALLAPLLLLSTRPR